MRRFSVAVKWWMLVPSVLLALFAFPFTPASYADDTIGVNFVLGEGADLGKDADETNKTIDAALDKINGVFNAAGIKFERKTVSKLDDPTLPKNPEEKGPIMTDDQKKVEEAGVKKANQQPGAGKLTVVIVENFKGSRIGLSNINGITGLETGPVLMADPWHIERNTMGSEEFWHTLAHELAHALGLPHDLLDSDKGYKHQGGGKYASPNLMAHDGTTRDIELTQDQIDILKQNAPKFVALGTTPIPTGKALASAVVKGHVRTAKGEVVTRATVTIARPQPTPQDFLSRADPGWDTKKDVQSPPFDTSGDDGSFVVTLQEELGMLPVSDVPVKDIIVTLDTRERSIALLKPGIKPTDFVNDHGLQDVKIISVPSKGGSLVIYPVPSDERKAKELLDAISKDDRVASSPEPDDCREIQDDNERLQEIEKKLTENEKRISNLEKQLNETKSESVGQVKKRQLESLKKERKQLEADKDKLLAKLRSSPNVEVGKGCETETIPVEDIPTPPLVPKQPAVQQGPKKWAVAIGVENKKLATEDQFLKTHNRPVESSHEGGIADAEEFAQVLEKVGFKRGQNGNMRVKLGYTMPKESRVMHDEVLEDLQWMKGEVEKAIKNGAKKEDLMIVFYFSGHGDTEVLAEVHRKETIERQRAFVYLSDFRLKDDELSQGIDAISAGKKLIILSASRLGGFLYDNDKLNTPGDLAKTLEGEERIIILSTEWLTIDADDKILHKSLPIGVPGEKGGAKAEHLHYDFTGHFNEAFFSEKIKDAFKQIWAEGGHSRTPLIIKVDPEVSVKKAFEYAKDITKPFKGITYPKELNNWPTWNLCGQVK